MYVYLHTARVEVELCATAQIERVGILSYVANTRNAHWVVTVDDDVVVAVISPLPMILLSTLREIIVAVNHLGKQQKLLLIHNLAY